MPVSRIHLHLLSDSTGETLENIAKAAIGLFENVEAIRHFWPMVRSEVHLDRIMEEISAHPGLVLFTLTNHVLRRQLETDRVGELEIQRQHDRVQRDRDEHRDVERDKRSDGCGLC